MISPRTADVVVIGGGVAGLSTAHALTDLGVTGVVVSNATPWAPAAAASPAARALPLRHPLAGRHGLAGLARAGERGRDPGRPFGLPPDRLPRRGWGSRTSVRYGPTSPCTSAWVLRSSWSATTPRRELWPAARWMTSPGSPTSHAGGYGDGHQTALAFAAAARHGGPTCASTVAWPRWTWRAGVCGASAWSTAAASVPPTSSWRPDHGPPIGRRRRRRPARAGPRAQILLVDPGRDLGPVPVFSDLVSLQYVRSEGSSSILLGDSDHSRPEWSDPDDYGSGSTTRNWPWRYQVRSPVPGARRSVALVVVRRLLRRDARLQPGDFAPHPSKGSGCAPDSRGTVTRSPPRSAS